MQDLRLSHHKETRVLYISQCTELGTIYTLEELKRLTDFAHLNGMYAHKDDTAAQLVNAVLTNTQMWDQDLTKIEGLEAAVLADLELIRTEGAEAAYKSCL